MKAPVLAQAESGTYRSNNARCSSSEHSVQRFSWPQKLFRHLKANHKSTRQHRANETAGASFQDDTGYMGRATVKLPTTVMTHEFMHVRPHAHTRSKATSRSLAKGTPGPPAHDCVQQRVSVKTNREKEKRRDGALTAPLGRLKIRLVTHGHDVDGYPQYPILHIHTTAIASHSQAVLYIPRQNLHASSAYTHSGMFAELMHEQ